MNTGLHQSQNLQQTQQMAPQMMQSLEWLQIPWMEMKMRIREELEKNPALDERLGSGPELVEGEAATQSAGLDEFRTEDDTDDFEPGDFAKEYEALARFADLPQTYPEAPTSEQQARHQYFMDSITGPDSLYEHLSGQLHMAGLSKDEKRAGEVIIGSLNEEGYLTAETAELAVEASVSEEVVKEVLDVIREFDPVGVGARNLQECLLAQLQRLGKTPENSVEAILVQQYLDELGTRDWDSLARKTGFSADAIRMAAHVISTLDPKPGLRFSVENTVYITPEIAVYRAANGVDWAVENVRDLYPRLYIQPDYREMLQSSGTDEDAKKFIRAKIRDGSFLMRCIHQRQITIRRIAEEIVRVQGDFLEHGVSRLKPLTMSEVAEKLGLHETTISRAVSGKYMQTPMGLFELRFFFTPGLRTIDGNTVSIEAVKNAVALVIEKEDVKRPFSDHDIALLLKEQGYQIARRTVAKYREQLGIPPSHLRK